MRRSFTCLVGAFGVVCAGAVLAQSAPAKASSAPATSAPATGSAATPLAVAPQVTPEALLASARNDALAIVAEAEAEARATVDAAKARAQDTLRAAATDVTKRAQAEAEQIAEELLERTRVESRLFSFGIFPNSAGFMDARLHVRMHYLHMFSSGVYLDYTTARALQENELVSRSDRLVREYRGEADLIKGVFLLADSGNVAWSVEPGVNAKAIIQEIDDTGFSTNSFDETIFQSSDLQVSQLGGSAKLETSLSLGHNFLFDLSGEYLPLIYQLERGTTVSSQFEEPVEFSLKNRTRGYQAQMNARLDTQQAGSYAVRGLVYSSKGDISAESSLVSGNFEYTFETFSNAKRFDARVELVHTATYIRLFGRLAPAIAIAAQRKRIETAADSLSADTYKIGFLLEWL